MYEKTRSFFRAQIKGLASEGVSLRTRMRTLCQQRWKEPGKQEEVLNGLSSARRDLGQAARYQLLAYGLLRGLPYRAMEASCRENNKPDPKKLHAVIAQWSRRSVFEVTHVLETGDAFSDPDKSGNTATPRTAQTNTPPPRTVSTPNVSAQNDLTITSRLRRVLTGLVGD